MVIRSIGFLVEDLSSSQLALSMISEINNYTDNNTDLNFNLFVEEQFMPCIHPRVPKIGIRDAFLFYGTLIATSLKTASYLGEFPRSKHFYYINDLEYLRKEENIAIWHKIMTDASITKFCRSEDYLEEIKKQGYNINDTIVRDFEIDKIMEIIDGKS